jgi:hypothetical protein
MSDSEFGDGLHTVSLSQQEVDERGIVTKSIPKPLLRSRPPIKFSQSIVASLVGSDFGVIIPTATHRHPPPPSHMSPLSLPPSQNPSTTHLFSHNGYPLTDPFVSPNGPEISAEIIMSLSVEQLQLHPSYRQLQQKYMAVCETLLRNNPEPRPTVVPHIYGLYLF